MGGSLVAQGNANRAAEFNFHSDPEAAHIVLHSSLKLNREKPVVQLVPWETCMDHKLPWSFYDEIARADTTLSKILRGITVLTESMLRDKVQIPQDSDHALDVYLYSLHQFLFPDIYATLVLLDEDAILKYHDWDIAVELEGRHSRGGCFVEWIPGALKVRNARVVSSLSTARLEAVLKETFLSASIP